MEDGKTLRDHLLSVWRQTKEEPEQLANAPELPLLAAHVWKHFLELRNEKGKNVMGTSRITSSDIAAWCWNTGVSLLLWERKAIAAIDSVWMEKQNGR